MPRIMCFLRLKIIEMLAIKYRYHRALIHVHIHVTLNLCYFIVYCRCTIITTPHLLYCIRLNVQLCFYCYGSLNTFE
jgi:hypothetical protein